MAEDFTVPIQSVAALCREHGKSYQEVYQMIVRAYHENQ